MTEVEREYERRWKAMTPAERIARSAAMLAWTRQQMARRIRSNDARLTDEEVKWHVALQLYEREPEMVKLIREQLSHVSVEAFERTILKFVVIAEAIDLRFHLTGGSISSAYGEPRLTQDIDIVVAPEIAKRRVDDLVRHLASSDFLFTEVAVRQAIQSGDLFQLWIRVKV